MSGLWDRLDVPHKGWRCVSVIDLEPQSDFDYASCEMCGNERIRYVHIMAHDAYAEELEVGCVCAEKMSDDYFNPRRAERKLRNRAARKAKWLSRKWRTSIKGNAYLNADGFNLVVFPNKYRPERWSFSIKQKAGGMAVFSKKTYGTEEEGKLGLFEQFWKILEAERDDEEEENDDLF